MAKIILEFDADTEKEEALTAQNASNYLVALQELDNEMRKVTKHDASLLGSGSPSEGERNLARWVRDWIGREVSDVW